jgi:RimJ/RimL family protein N-acetyltransferase
MDDSAWKQALATIQKVKEKPAARSSWIPVFQFGRKLAWLEPVNKRDLDHPESLALLNDWRRCLPANGLADCPATAEGTRTWLARHVLEAADQLLFWVKGLDGTPLGTVGLGRFDFAGKQVEIDHLVRGVPEVLPGLMYATVQTLLGWTFQTFPVTLVTAQVSSDNARASRLYERCGFGPDTEHAAAGKRGPSAAGEEVTLSLSRSEWMAAHRLDRVA